VGPTDHNPKTTDRQEELRLSIEQGILDLHRARAEYDKLLALRADAQETPDGTLALEKAIEVHRDAFRKLSEAVKAFEALRSSRHPATHG
jgi:hypothetical protein